jgi:hypothetical protein
MGELDGLLTGKQKLLFHRNMIEAIDAYGSRISRDFQIETGIVVNHSFVNRSLGGMRIKVTPGIGEEGIPKDFKARLGKFLKTKKDYLKAYVGAAIKCTLNDTDIKSALRIMDPEKPESTQWMGNSIKIDVSEKNI